MVLNDRTTKGFIAGISGGIVMNIISFISYYLGIANLRFVDWPAIIITGQIANNAFKVGFFLIVQLVFVGFLGIVFAHLISNLITSTYHLLKGVIFGLLSWFVIYAFTYLAKVAELTPLSMNSALTDFVGAITFGLVLAEMLNILDDKAKLD